MKLKTSCPGVNTYVPKEFIELYLAKSFSEVEAFRADINISVQFKMRGLITPSGWDYHLWLDSFLETIRLDFAHNAFFKRIDWIAALTIATIARNLSRKQTAKG